MRDEYTSETTSGSFPQGVQSIIASVRELPLVGVPSVFPVRMHAATMKDWMSDVNRRIEARREAVDLSDPPTYTGVLRYVFWKGAPGFVGPAVIVIGQVALYETKGVVLFGGGTVLFTVAVLAATAQIRKQPVHIATLVLVAVGLFYGMFRWSVERGIGIAAWLVLFFGFVSVIIAGVARVTIPNQVSNER